MLVLLIKWNCCHLSALELSHQLALGMGHVLNSQIPCWTFELCSAAIKLFAVVRWHMFAHGLEIGCVFVTFLGGSRTASIKIPIEICILHFETQSVIHRSIHHDDWQLSLQWKLSSVCYASYASLVFIESLFIPTERTNFTICFNVFFGLPHLCLQNLFLSQLNYLQQRRISHLIKCQFEIRYETWPIDSFRCWRLLTDMSLT